MAQPKHPIISVKIPISWDSMTERNQQRLRQIVGRDTRVIKAILGVIRAHEKEILFGKKRKRIDQIKLDALTTTTAWGKNGNPPRPVVPHDIKQRFPRISANELADCRRTATAIYDSYLSLRGKRGQRASRPRVNGSSRRIPRWTFPRCFKLVNKQQSRMKWWIDLRDALDSAPANQKIHDRLLIPLKMSPFHTNQLNRGKTKALQILTDRHGKWWVVLAVEVHVQDHHEDSADLPKAILGIDLGVKKAACTTLLTEKKVSETRYFVQKDKVRVLIRLDKQVAQLQHERNLRQNNGMKHEGVTRKLRAIRSKRGNVAKEYDRVLVRQLLDYIQELGQGFDLYIALGRVKGIRARARRGNYQGPKYRRMVHSWAFARITENLKHRLVQSGWKVEGRDTRFLAVPEQWTSIKCWKCGRKGLRPKQSLFVCSCGFRTNADRNGSLNIARRLIKLIPSLKNGTTGLGRWAFPERAPAPKTGRKALASKRKSSLSSKGVISHLGESAAVHHAQMSLPAFGDEFGRGDDDPAVERTAETLAVARMDMPGGQQKQEARSIGGRQVQ